jgi:NAD(P)-dependent dehydrogenase (short-subunit alcohol dehydrogenase family)
MTAGECDPAPWAASSVQGGEEASMGGVRKVAFVTGASSGIGRATAEAFVAEGYATVLVDRDEAAGRRVQEMLSAQGECAFVRCDVTDDAEIAASIAETVRLYGRLDAAFNAAGIGGDVGLTADGTLENWSRVIDVDLTGVWRCMRQQIPQMLQTGGGAIVNCASKAGLGGAAHLSAYSAAKHGVIGLTRTAALEYARRGIRVNAVCPGFIDTPLTQSIPAEAAAALVAWTPMGRPGAAAEVAAAVLWLCSDAASFVTGEALAVDGGMAAS